MKNRMNVETTLGRLSVVALLCAVVGWTVAVGAEGPPPSPEAVVRAYVEAANARELEALLALATDGIEWLSVEGTRVAVETSGRAALREALVGYYQGCPSCRSSLEWMETAGSRVAAYERASWTDKDGVARSQTSLSVYELVGNKIARVYYFPVER